MLRTRLAVIIFIASMGIFGAAAPSGSAAAGAQAALSIVVTPNSVAPGGQISYAISNATCVPGGGPSAVFTWTMRDSAGVPTGAGSFLMLNSGFTGGALTSAPFAAPTVPGSYSITIVGENACQGQNATAPFVVQAPATTTPPTTAPPTTAAPTTTAAAAVPPAPTTAAPTTAAAPAAAPTALPATGQESNLAVVALLLCLGGGGLVVATRRR